MNHQDKDMNRDPEPAEALLWLKKIAERAARNRRESGLDVTQQIKDVLAIDVESFAGDVEPASIRQSRSERPITHQQGLMIQERRQLTERMSAIETNSAAFLTSVRSLRRICTLLAASVIALIAFGGIGAYRFLQLQRQERASLAAALEREKQEFVRARQDLIREVGPPLYAAKVRSGLDRLSGRPQDRDKAIWDYLLRSLQESQTKDEFFDVVVQFKNVVPRLQLAIDRATYRDSFRGELWIAVYLLESHVDEIARQTRRVLPPIKRLRALYAAVSPELQADQREDLARSIDRLERAMKADRS
jgi:hypothetical protein